jgi:hypothetical protein
MARTRRLSRGICCSMDLALSVLPHVILLPDASRAMLPTPFSRSWDPDFPVERRAVCHRRRQKADAEATRLSPLLCRDILGQFLTVAD